MGYGLGVDLGTTFTAAAVHDGDRARMLTLGSTGQAVPSLVFVRDDGEVLVGEAADRRALTQPHRVARAAKRLLGDPTPVYLGGTPFSAATLMARMLDAVVALATEREGGPPERVVVTHPANWGPYKRETFAQVLAQADLADADTLTEPEAAAIHYARAQRLEPGDTVAVYDLGGGTFDAAVLRRTGHGFELVGQALGVEHLGGIDFDAAVLRHVVESLDLDDGDEDDRDEALATARSQLARSCVEAKIALSSDNETVIPVLLPGRSEQVRLTRREFESMIEPVLAETTRALQRVVANAKVEPDDLRGVLLVGGSSRIPLIGQLVQQAMGRPVHLDADPKAAVALGASEVAAGAWPTGSDRGPVAEAPSPTPPPPAPPPPAPPPPAPPPLDPSSAPRPAPDGLGPQVAVVESADGRSAVLRLATGLRCRVKRGDVVPGTLLEVVVTRLDPLQLRLGDRTIDPFDRPAAVLLDGELVTTDSVTRSPGQVRPVRGADDVARALAGLPGPFVLGVGHELSLRERAEISVAARAAGASLSRLAPVASLAAAAVYHLRGGAGRLGMVTASSAGARLTPVEVGDGVVESKGPSVAPTGADGLFSEMFGGPPTGRERLPPPAEVVIPVGSRSRVAADDTSRAYGISVDEPVDVDRIALMGSALEQAVIDGHLVLLPLHTVDRTLVLHTPGGERHALFEADESRPLHRRVRVDEARGRFLLYDERDLVTSFEVEATDLVVEVDVDANGSIDLGFTRADRGPVHLAPDEALALFSREHRQR